MAEKQAYIKVNAKGADGKALNKPYMTGGNKTARMCYGTRLTEFNGKPLAAFVESVAKKVPSTPNKGKGTNKPEKISGWISFFVTEGVLTLVDK